MTKDKLMKMIDAYAEGKLIRDWVEASVDQYTKAQLKQATVSPAPSLQKVNRIEVIDDKGRSYVNWNDANSVHTDLQDAGRTLKVFITKQK